MEPLVRSGTSLVLRQVGIEQMVCSLQRSRGRGSGTWTRRMFAQRHLSCGELEAIQVALDLQQGGVLTIKVGEQETKCEPPSVGKIMYLQCRFHFPSLGDCGWCKISKDLVSMSLKVQGFLGLNALQNAFLGMVPQKLDDNVPRRRVWSLMDQSMMYSVERQMLEWDGRLLCLNMFSRSSNLACKCRFSSLRLSNSPSRPSRVVTALSMQDLRSAASAPASVSPQ